MRIDLDSMHAGFRAIQSGKESEHSAQRRIQPSAFQYDFLTLDALSRSLRELVSLVPDALNGAVALDIGSDRAPYRTLIEGKGYCLKTLDLIPDYGADYVGTAEETNLPDAAFDLVICTQVLEHCPNPWIVMREIRRILAPGGHALISVPHVWFYHPHPGDYWRFTQEGVTAICRESGMIPVELRSQGGTILAVAQVLNFALYGVLGRWGSPLYAVTNVIGGQLDRIAPNELFCVNFACLARRS